MASVSDAFDEDMLLTPTDAPDGGREIVTGSAVIVVTKALSPCPDEDGMIVVV